MPAEDEARKIKAVKEEDTVRALGKTNMNLKATLICRRSRVALLPYSHFSARILYHNLV